MMKACTNCKHFLKDSQEAPCMNCVSCIHWESEFIPVTNSALSKQVAGDHYKDKKIQPIEYIHANGLGFCVGNVVKYISRYKEKNGAEDIRKAIHYCELLLELEYGEKD